MRRVLVRVAPVLLLGGFLVLLFGQSTSAEKAVKSLLEAKCAACHGDVRMSDLDLRQRATILKGGKRGPAVVPGNAEASLLYKAVRREGELQMPPGKTGLTPSELTLVRDWINKGAPWESSSPIATSTTGAAPAWWSFRKPVRPAVPAVKNAAGV